MTTGGTRGLTKAQKKHRAKCKKHVSNVLRGMRRRGMAARQVGNIRQRLLLNFSDELHYGNLGMGIVCSYCREIVRCLDAGADHGMPLSRGGGNTSDNIIICHKKCNLAKGDMSGDEFRKLREWISENFSASTANNLMSRLRAAGWIYSRCRRGGR